MSISDERLAELIEQASQGDPIRVGYMEDMETALRELQQLRTGILKHWESDCADIGCEFCAIGSKLKQCPPAS